MEGHQVTFLLAFTAGLLSFLSPCVLPLVPSYITYITGLSFEELRDHPDRARVRWLAFTHSLSFIAGFSIIFILFGATATLIGRFLLVNQDVIRQLGGILIILFGLYILGILKIPYLSREHRIHLQERPLGYVGSFLVGIAFAAGWTPCVGPILGAILTYAGTTESLSRGIALLAVYSLGLGLPLLLSAVGFNALLLSIRKIRPFLPWVTRMSGALVVFLGILVLTDSFSRLTDLLTQWGVGWYVGQ